MAVQTGRWKRCGVMSVVLGAASAASMAQSQSFVGKPPVETSIPLRHGTPVGLSGDDIIRAMLEHNRLRNEQLQRYSAVRTYEIRTVEGRLAAQAVVRVDYEAPDNKRFKKTSEKGSGIVRRLVFDRLLQSERETSSRREHHNSAITPANYTFTVVGEDEVGPSDCGVLDVTPVRGDGERVGGNIWVAADDFAIMRIAGQPAKKPSFWINRADFVREYQRIDGFWLPLRDETYVEVKMYGRRVFTVEHEQYVINPRSPLQAGTGETSDPDEPLR